MSRVGKVLLPVAALLLLTGFVVAAVVRAGADEPDPRPPLDLGSLPPGETPAPPASPPTPPASEPTPSRATVITPQPEIDDDDDDDDDDGRDDGRWGRGDDRRGGDDRDDRGDRDDHPDQDDAPDEPDEPDDD
ncbi:hypothetical protein RB608_17485 [Nocardioides sp. LHD-245]|uniref:hypothetical protein n=1 Tax=Nocardioides sp. LHD-245 TaxID=3051387 RepID=UPI0027E08CE3|nr:hypothetical protein [Nocardioides sp. LHD-245]